MDRVTGDRELYRRFEAIRRGTATEAILGRFGNLAVQYAKRNAHPFRKTGNLEASIRVLSIDVNAGTVRIGAGGTKLVRNAVTGGSINAGYAAHVEFGTRPHLIRPRRKKVLFFPSQQALNRNVSAINNRGFLRGGQLRYRLTGNLTNRSTARFGTMAYQYAMVVKHPGTRAQPYLLPGAKEALRNVGLADQVVQTWNDAA